MKHIFLIFLLMTCQTFATTQSEEKLFAQRILAFYQDHQYEIATEQISTFLRTYPKSSHSDLLLELQGLIYLKEKKYDLSIDTFEKIDQIDQNRSAYLHYLEALFLMKDFEKLLFATENVENRSSFSSHMEALSFYKAISLYFFAQKVSGKKRRGLLLKSEALLQKVHNKVHELLKTKLLLEISSALQKHQKTIFFAKKLQKLDPLDKERYLFFEGMHLTQTSPAEAQRLFESLCKQEGPYQTKALRALFYNLHAQKKYKQILERLNLFDEMHFTKKPLFYSIVAGSFFHVDDFDKTKLWLEKIFATPTDPTSLAWAIDHLAKMASQKENLQWLEEAMAVEKKYYQAKRKLALFFYLHSSLALEKNELEKAETSLDALAGMERGDKLEGAFSTLRIKIAHAQKKYAQVCALCRTYLEEGLSANKSAIVQIWLQAAEHIPGPDQALKALAKMKDNPLFSQSQRGQILYRMAQLDDNVEQKTALLEELLRNHPGHALIAKTHFLFALCKKEFPLIATHHLEKALQLDVAIQKKEEVYIELFNLYFSLWENFISFPKWHIQAAHTPLERAAACLNWVFTHKPSALNAESCLWLADFYCKQIQISIEKDWKIERTLFQNGDLQMTQKILQSLKNEPLDSKLWLAIHQKMTLCYHWLGYHKMQVQMIERLFDKLQPQDTPFFCFYSAQAYTKLQQTDKAIEKYNRAIDNGREGYYVDLSKLYLARLEKKLSRSPHRYLSHLKAITFNKTIELEPLFLEAGIDYVFGSKTPANKNPHKYRLFLLQRLHDDFSKSKDLIATNYHEKRKALPHKDHIYQGYLFYIESYMHYLQVLLKEKEKASLEKRLESLHRREKELSSISEYLQEKTQIIIDLIKRI